MEYIHFTIHLPISGEMQVWQLLLGLLLLSDSKEAAFSRLLKFTNIKCQELPTNNGFCRFDYCRLKVVKRNQVELSLRASLFQLPVTNFTTRLQCFQRTDGYRPFFYNVYFDFCKVMSARKYRWSFEDFIFNEIRPFSNFNHSCPWTENYIAVEKYALDSAKVNMPVPSGFYRLDFTFYAYGVARTLTQIFFEKLE